MDKHLKDHGLGPDSLLYLNISTPLEILVAGDRFNSDLFDSSVFNKFPSRFSKMDLVFLNPGFHENRATMSEIQKHLESKNGFKLVSTEIIDEFEVITMEKDGKQHLKIHLPPEDIILDQHPDLEQLRQYIGVGESPFPTWIMHAYDQYFLPEENLDIIDIIDSMGIRRKPHTGGGTNMKRKSKQRRKRRSKKRKNP